MDQPPNPITTALEMLHRDRDLWRFRARLDPAALPEMIEIVVSKTGMPPDVARRVIESELDLQPPPAEPVRSRRPTRRDGIPAARPRDAAPSARLRD